MIEYHHAYFYDADQQSPIDVSSSEISIIKHWCTRLTRQSSFHIYIKAKRNQAKPNYSQISQPAMIPNVFNEVKVFPHPNQQGKMPCP